VVLTSQIYALALSLSLSLSLFVPIRRFFSVFFTAGRNYTARELALVNA